MEVKRQRPIKLYVVLVAFGPYRKGDKIQPTGMYRDVLLKRGIIREVDDVAAVSAAPLADRAIVPPQPELVLANREIKRRR